MVPLTVDGVIYASSMVMLDSARRKAPVPAGHQGAIRTERHRRHGIVGYHRPGYGHIPSMRGGPPAVA